MTAARIARRLFAYLEARAQLATYLLVVALVGLAALLVLDAFRPLGELAYRITYGAP